MTHRQLKGKSKRNKNKTMDLPLSFFLLPPGLPNVRFSPGQCVMSNTFWIKNNHSKKYPDFGSSRIYGAITFGKCHRRVPGKNSEIKKKEK